MHLAAERPQGLWHPDRPPRRDHRDDDLLEAGAGLGPDDPGGIELGQRLVAIAAGLVAGVLAGAGPLEDRDDLGDLGRARVVVRVQLAQPLAILGTGVLVGVDDRQRLLAVDDVGRLLAGRLFRAPDAEQVVVELEGEAQRPAEAAIAGDDLLVLGGEQRRRPRSRRR